MAIVLTASVGLTRDIAWGSSQGVLLIAYAATALAVITIGTLDVLLARLDVKHRYGATAVGQMNKADGAVVVGQAGCIRART
jgi:hypothetical protein